jgi:bis(5'-nucleosyl)-tetraphosphatase (symmetrical)
VATYVVGDVQGCAETLRALVAALDFDPARDRLLFAGDLVNRGPLNAAVLRFVMGLGPAAQAVLGNHDLHLIGRALGVFAAKRRDTLEDVLTAPDRDAMVDWLRARPFVLPAGAAGDPLAGHLIVHAGLPPGMTPVQALAESAGLSARLRSDAAPALLRQMRDPPCAWAAAVASGDAGLRARVALQGFTLMRACLADTTPDPHFSGALIDLPPFLRPWFEFDAAARATVTVHFGHWAALGVHRGPGVQALDSGCVWGRALTALCLETGRIHQMPNRDALSADAGDAGES